MQTFCLNSVLLLHKLVLFFPVKCPRGLLAQCHYNNSRLIIIITIITTLGNSHYIRGCLCDMQLLTLAAELFTMDQCLVLLRAFCSMDDNSKVEFQTCLTQMAEKVYYITHYATGVQELLFDWGGGQNLEEAALNSARRSGGAPPVGSGVEPQLKSNVVHFSLKI